MKLSCLNCQRTLIAAVLLVCLGSMVGLSAAQSPEDTLPRELPWQDVPIGFDALPDVSKSMPQSAAKIALGRKLFFDPVLSSNQEVSCASCHRPDHGFASPDPLAVGVDGKVGTRNAPTILNVAYAGSFNWDGRSDSLEDQVVGPLTSDVEMGNANVGEVVDRISAIPEYVTLFQKAFPAKIEGPVTEKRLLEAIAQFERALIRGGNGVDRFRRQEYTALSKEARSGMWIFESRGGCWRCHSGPTLSDNQFHNTGVSFGTEKRDEGRFNATEQAEHRFQFRTPTLRNVALTPPYMHDGSIKSLKEVVEFYNRGGSVKDPLLDSKMKPLGLNDEEVSYLVAFLEALNSEPFENQPAGDPKLPQSESK